jgi:tRNA dimethylallyltransferase
MQVYRGMDVGTAKPTLEERGRIRHHLIDVVEPGEAFDAATWLTMARGAAVEVERGGGLPVICGGTGLYFRLWLEGAVSLPPSDRGIRAELEREPLERLVAELRDKAPEALDRIDLQNPRRVVRAVEILRLTGFLPKRSVARNEESTGGKVVVLVRSRDDLRQRVERRVDRMFTEGWVEEVWRLREAGLRRDSTAGQALGYRQILEHLDGERDLVATRELVKVRTWQYVRRQMTWFRHQVPSIWLEVGSEEGPDQTAERVMEAGGWMGRRGDGRHGAVTGVG